MALTESEAFARLADAVRNAFAGEEGVSVYVSTNCRSIDINVPTRARAGSEADFHVKFRRRARVRTS